VSTNPLPPGQHAIDRFPRFGTHLHDPAPTIPADFAIELTGALAMPLSVSLAQLSSLERRELIADFHCVAGWSARGLRWEGVPFATFYSSLVEPSLRSSTTITHVAFEGLDGFSSHMRLEDALADDVLIADRLNGSPLGPAHGAPVRLVAPNHYGFINVKHLARIEFCTKEPRGYGNPPLPANVGLRLLGYGRLPRARVWEEERHRFLPARVIRLAGRFLIPPIGSLSSRRPSE
jgi:DMSO/TMAO reductase YedYZ molybdopterin-dependent catalytic subunit